MEDKTFDVAVIGAGPGGYVAAIRAADLGASVALIESGRSGGVCLNVGCIPTKAMLHASELYYELATAGPGLGIGADNLRFDLAAQLAAKDKTVARLRSGLDKVISQRPNITRFVAHGRLAGPGKVALFDPADRARPTGELLAPNVILATGSRPTRPAAFSFDSTHIVTTDEVLSLPQRPRRMLVLGGGVNGCEQATFFAEIGVEVTIVEALERILPTVDEDISREVAKGLKKRKVTILAGRRAASIEWRADGEGVSAVLDDGTRLEIDVALVAIGRTPNTDGLGLETVGLAADRRGYLAVDDRCRTAAAGVYAVGDMTGVAPYAHVAFRQGAVAAANVAGRDEADDMTIIPAGIFTHPEVGTVGLTEAGLRHGEARAVGDPVGLRPGEAGASTNQTPVKVARFPLAALGIAQAQQLTSGWIKVLADPASGRVLGAAAVAPRAVEVIHEIALAMRGRMTMADLAGLIHAHPTYSEMVKEAAEHFLGLPIHGLKS